MLAPLAIIPILSPGHIAAEIPVSAIPTVGVGLTISVNVAESLHAPLEPTTLYVVVSAGLAVGLGHVEQLKPVVGDHTYVAAPPAFNTVLPPEQILDAPGVMETGNEAATETTSVTGDAGHAAAEFPVIVYVVVDTGVAFTVAPVDALRVAEGVHVYVVAPDAVIFTLPPGQIVGVNGATLIVGVVFTVTVTVCGEAAAQPAAEDAFNVYVIVTDGVAVTGEPVLAVNAVLGVHVYVAAPLAVNVVGLPEHIVGELAEAVTVGVVFTVITVVLGPEAGHPAADVPFNVYVTVMVGVAVTGDPVEELKLVFGVHVYVVAPPPVRVVGLPEQMVAGPLIVKVGVAFTVTTTVTGVEGEQPAAVPFNVYVVVTKGVAVTTAPVDALSVALGVQV